MDPGRGAVERGRAEVIIFSSDFGHRLPIIHIDVSTDDLMKSPRIDRIEGLAIY